MWFRLIEEDSLLNFIGSDCVTPHIFGIEFEPSFYIYIDPNLIILCHSCYDQFYSVGTSLDMNWDNKNP